MYSKITQVEMNSIISKYTDFNFLLEDHEYFCKKSENLYTYSFSVSYLQEGFNFDQWYIGIPILQINRDKIRFYPPVLSILKDIRVRVVSKSQSRKFTFGKPIALEIPDGECLIKDQHGRILAFGIVDQGNFIPVIDVGMYLRNEDKW